MSNSTIKFTDTLATETEGIAIAITTDGSSAVVMATLAMEALKSGSYERPISDMLTLYVAGVADKFQEDGKKFSVKTIKSGRLPCKVEGDSELEDIRDDPETPVVFDDIQAEADKLKEKAEPIGDGRFRPYAEIYKMHDDLMAVLKKAPMIDMSQQKMKEIAIVAGSLCWVMKHNHANPVEDLMDEIVSLSLELEDVKGFQESIRDMLSAFLKGDKNDRMN